MSTYILSIIAEGKDNASGPLRSLAGAFASIGTITAGILSAGVITQIGQSIASMGGQALAATASWERLGLAMTAMTAREIRNIDATLSQSDALALAGEKSKELMGWIEQLAIKSPFDAESIATSFRQAQTYGFASDEAKRLTQVLTDMSAGMGLTSDKMNLVSYALGQINQSDKLLMLDLRQLMNAGVPVNDILQTMGYSLNDVGKEAISSGDFLAAFSTMMEEDFKGAALNAATSWAGLTNSLSDIKSIGLREFFSSTFTAIQPYVAAFVDKFTDPAFKESLRKWGEPLGELAGKLMEFVTSLNSGDLDIGAALESWSADFVTWTEKIDWPGVNNAIVAGINGIGWAGIGETVGTLAGNIFTGITTAASEIDWVGIASTITDGLTQALAGLGTGAGGTISITDLLGLDAAQVAGIQATLDPIIASISNFVSVFMQTAGPALAVIGASFVAAWETMKPALTALWDMFVNQLPGGFNVLSAIIPVVIGIISVGIGLIAGIITAIVTGITTAITGILSAGELIRTGLSGIFEGILGIASGWWQMVQGIFTGNMEMLKTGWNDLWAGFANVISGVFTTIAGLIASVLMSSLGFIAGFISGVIGYFTNLYNVLVGHSIIPDMMKAIFASITTWLASALSSFVNWVSNVVGAINNWKTMISAALQLIKYVFVEKVTSWVQSAINTIISLGETLVKSVKTLMDTLLKSVKPVSFSISLPNFDELAQLAYEGFLLVQNALNGKAGKKKIGASADSSSLNGAGSGSGGNSSSDYVQSFSGGGIATGPVSGYMANLHGTEAVIPMKNGSIPVALNAPRSDGGGVVNNSNTITINVNGSGDPETIAREIFRILKVQGVTA